MAITTSSRSAGRTAIPLLAGLFAALGVGAIAFLVASIVTNAPLQAALSGNDAGDILLTFLNSFGIVLPIMIIGFGVYMLRLAARITQRDYNAGLWAQLILFWLMIILGVLMAAYLINNTTGATPRMASEWLGGATIILVFGVMCAAGWYWLSLNFTTNFLGSESLSSRDSRLAWNLLIPTIIILILVAARPLERTFIASLTDQRFAGGESNVTNFIGLSNYGALLGFRIDNIPCETTEDGTCKTEEVEIENIQTQEIAIDNAALRDILAKLVAGERVAGVANLLNAIGQPDIIQNAIDDESVDIAATMQSLDGERPLGTTMLQSMLNVSYPDVAINRLIAVNGATAQVEVTVIETQQEIVYPRPRDVVGDDYRELGFTPVNSFDIFGSHYVLSARDANFITAIGNTLFFAFVSVSLELVLGMIIALTVNSKFSGRGLMRAAMLVPWAIPTVVSARLWEVMLRDNQSGVINNIMMNLGILQQPAAWLANPDIQILSLIFVDVWKTTPFFALLLLAGLQTIPADIYEAADVDGASKVRQFFNITLPLLRPTIAVALVFRTLDAVRAFDVFDVLLGKKLQSMATYNSFVLIENQDFGYASAVGVTMFIIIFTFTIIYVRALGVEAD